MKVEVVSKRRLVIGEGPHWDEKEARLWHVDVQGGEVCKLDPLTGDTQSRSLGGFVSLVVPYSSDPKRLLVSNDRQLRHLDWESLDQGSLIAEPQQGKVRFNDGKCDATGRLWAGTMGLESAPAVLEPGQGFLYSLETDLTVRTHLDKVSISNGLAWTRDNKTMFFVDSLTKKVVAFDFDLQKGDISNQRTVHELGPGDGYPDGMCIDTSDHLWLACFAGSKVIGIDPATGVRTHTITFPADKITSCCFGGPNYEDLYVTSASVHVEKKALPTKDGAVFRVSGLGVKGLPPNNFRG